MSTITAPVTSTSEDVLTSTNADGQVVTYTSVITVTGRTTVVTAIQTVDPSGSNSLNNAAAQNGSTGFFSNTGAVAGTFLAVGIAVAALILGGLFFIRRKRRQRALDEDLRVAAGGAGDGGAGTSRFHDDDLDDDLDESTNAHGSFGSPRMTQYSPFNVLPQGAAHPSGTNSYYTGPHTTESGGSHGMGSLGAGAMAAAGAGAGAGAAVGYGYNNAPQYSYGSNQAYNDQYAVAQQYTNDNPYGDWNEVQQPVPTRSGSGSGEGSGESDPYNRRDSRYMATRLTLAMS